MPVILLFRRLRRGGSWFQASWGKKQFMIPHLNGKKLGRVKGGVSSHPPKIGGSSFKLACAKSETFSPTNQGKKGWRHDSINRVYLCKALSSNPSIAKKSSFQYLKLL
jgi:hypothetical protein